MNMKANENRMNTVSAFIAIVRMGRIAPPRQVRGPLEIRS
jgi:hypothetical protein